MHLIKKKVLSDEDMKKTLINTITSSSNTDKSNWALTRSIRKLNSDEALPRFNPAMAKLTSISGQFS
ncbi:hypothetical protein [uncultured Gammaproteobacteria bacterium]|nr:hypothetical protein [uncultured Gammaproteobacteria bacterium]